MRKINYESVIILNFRKKEKEKRHDKIVTPKIKPPPSVGKLQIFLYISNDHKSMRKSKKRKRKKRKGIKRKRKKQV